MTAEKPKRDALGKWPKGVSGNPAGISQTAVLVRRAIAERAEELTSAAISSALAGDPTALSICMTRLWPAAKATLEPVHIDGLAEAKTTDERVAAILAAIGRGQLPPDVGQALLGALETATTLTDIADMKVQLAELMQERNL